MSERESRNAIEALADWYQRQKLTGPAAEGLSVGTADDGDCWITFDLGATRLSGHVVTPLVHDLGGGVWFQAWSDGSRLTVAASCPGLPVAAAYLLQRYPAPRQRAAEA